MGITAKITSKGQVTLPKSVRDRLDVGSGDVLEFRFDSNDHLHVAPVKRSVFDLVGMIRRSGQRPVSVEALNEAIGRSRAEDDERIRSGRGS